MNLQNVYSTEEYQAYRKEQANKFRDIIPDEEKIVDLSERFRVVFNNYHTIYSDPSYATAKVFDGDEVVYEYDNICPHYYFNKLIEHSNGHSYYIFRIDAQGYSVFDLTEKYVTHYIPQNMLDAPNDESLFLFILDYNQNNNIVAAHCYYWGPIERPMLFDFSKPSKLPLPYVDVPCEHETSWAREIRSLKWDNDILLWTYDYEFEDEHREKFYFEATSDIYLKWFHDKYDK